MGTFQILFPCAKGGHVHPSPAADRSAEMASAPGMGLVSKALVFEPFRVNLFIVIVTDKGVAAQRAQLAAQKEMLSFGKEVMTSCWKEERPTAGTPTVRRGSPQNLNPTLVPLESWGEEKEEVAVPPLTWSAGAQSGCCVGHGTEAAPKGHHQLMDTKGISCHYGTNNAEGE